MVYEINRSRFSTLEESYAEFTREVLSPGLPSGFDPGLTNLDALDDILSGGTGTPDDGFTLRWKNHQVSRERLGYPETIRQLELRLAQCHPTARRQVAQKLKQAQAHQGPTVFDWLTEIIHEHGPGGEPIQPTEWSFCSTDWRCECNCDLSPTTNAKPSKS